MTDRWTLALVLGKAVVQHRLQLLTEVIRLLLTMVPQQRERALREERTPYSSPSGQAPQAEEAIEVAVNDRKLDKLLQNVPLPSP